MQDHIRLIVCLLSDGTTLHIIRKVLLGYICLF